MSLSFEVNRGLADHYPFDEKVFLYNSKDYLQTKVSELGEPLSYLAFKGDLAVARIRFFLEEKGQKLQAISVPQSPFGSVEYGAIYDHELESFLKFVVSDLDQRSVRLVTVKDCISAYRTDALSVHQLLLSLRFCIAEKLTNHHIPVSGNPLEARMHNMEKRRLRKCQREGLNFLREPSECLAKGYKFVLKCRQEKGWKLSMTGAQFNDITSLIPEYYYFFSVYHQQHRVAAAICVRPAKDILYVFYPGSLQAYQQYSPMTLLLKGIYQFCQEQQIRLLDLGTSEQPGLIHFKAHMGGQSSFKHTYQLYLP